MVSVDASVRNRVLPGAGVGIAIIPRFDRVELADGAGADQVLDLVVKNRAGKLAADLKDGVRLLLDGNYGGPLLDPRTIGFSQ